MRYVAAFAAALVITGALYPLFLSVLVRFHARQRVAAYGPSTHMVKEGTPTMGGLLFIAVVAAEWLILDGHQAGFVVAFALIAGAAVGFLDDLANSRGSLANGLGGHQKLVLQTVCGALVGVGLYRIGATQQLVPFFGSSTLGIALIVVAALAVVAASNAVNLTDGVDGLAASCAAICFGGLLVVAVHQHQVGAAVLAAAVCGTLGAFLFYNWQPARVFMGDTGSLALGCGLVALTAELHLLWLLPLLGIIFVAETLSVIINVTAIKRFGTRIFRASPIHHHFEELGVSEPRLVLGFSLVGALAALLTVVLAWSVPA